MIGLLRALLWRRVRWLAVGAATRWALRRVTARSIDQATAEFEQRLPAPVKRAIDDHRLANAIPIDPVRTGGSALAAGRAAKRASQLAADTTRTAGAARRSVIDRVGAVRSIGADLNHETETARRELTSRYLRSTRGPGPADDALLDLRNPVRADRGEDDEHDGALPLDRVPEPVTTGRRRAPRRRIRSEVPRVQRSYRPRTRPWDR